MTNSWEVHESSVPAVFIQQQRGDLQECLEKIEHCFAQLSEEDVWWRPYEEHNALGNILLHLCGNLGQWIINGVTGKPDTRDRPLEFSHREPVPKDQLLDWLRQTIGQADLVISEQTEQTLLEPRTVQGFRVQVQSAIQHSVSHLCGHTQEIIWITRLRVGPGYKFRWVPTTPEEGASA